MLTKIKLGLKVLKKVAKIIKGGKNAKAAAQQASKKYYLIGGIAAFILIVPVIIADAEIKAILCFTNLYCKYEAVDPGEVKDSADYLEKTRNDEWGDLKNSSLNEKFRTSKEASSDYIKGLSKEDQKDFVPKSQAEILLRTLLALDQTVYQQITIKDTKKGGPLADTIIDTSLTKSKDIFDGKLIRMFQKKSAEEKQYKSNKEHYLLDYRLAVYMCYLADDECNDDTEAVLDGKKNIAISNNGDDFDNAAINDLFDKFYEISFFKAAEGKTDFVPKGKGKELYDQYLQEYLEQYNNLYPSSLPGDLMNSNGWLVPLEDKTYRFSSGFGLRTCDGINGCTADHKGVDLATGVEEVPIYAAKAGVVKKLGYDATAGWTIAIDHLDGYYTIYLHMKSENRLVKEGQKVAQGQMIGGTGNQGASSGPHLHFEICKKLKESGFCEDGYSIDPNSKGYYKGMFTSTIVTKNRDAAVARFKKEKAHPSPANKPAMMPGLSNKGGLGALTMKYEGSSYDAGCTQQVGGYATCGPYQLYGSTLANFLKNTVKPKYPEFYAPFANVIGPSFYSKELNKAFLSAANINKNKWVEIQREFLIKNNYDPLLKRVKQNFNIDISTRSKATQEMLFSAAIFENNGFITVLQKAQSNGYKLTSLTDQQFLTVVYQYRMEFHYIKSPARNWAQRFIPEYLDAVSIYSTGTFNPKKTTKSYSKGDNIPGLGKVPKGK